MEKKRKLESIYITNKIILYIIIIIIAISIYYALWFVTKIIFGKLSKNIKKYNDLLKSTHKLCGK